MNCHDVKNKIIFYIDNELQEFEAENIKQHINSCSKCKNTHEILLNSYKVLEDEKNKEVNNFIATSIIAKINYPNNTLSKFKLKYIVQPALTFGIIILGIILGNNLTDIVFPPKKNTAKIIPTQYTKFDKAHQYVINDYLDEDYYFINQQ